MSIATRIQSINEHIEDAYDSLSKMGVTANNKNIENIAGLVNQIYENAPKTDYVSGVDLTIENTLKGKIDYKDTDTIEKIGFGNTSQTGTPTPSSPIDVQVVKGNQNILIQNQNIMRINKTFPYTDRAVTYSYSNGQFNLSGTANNNNIYMMIYQPNGVPIFNSGDTITIKSETNWDYTSRVEFLKSDSKFLVGATKNSTQTITFEADCYGYRVWYDAQSSKNFSNIYQKIEIEKGTTTPSEYIVPKEENYEIDLPVENLFNGLIEVGNITDGENYSDSNVVRSVNYIKVNPNTKYCFSINGVLNKVVICYYDKDKIYTNSSSTGVATTTGIFTTDADTQYIRFRCYAADKTLFLNGNLQIELGEKANAYTPYGTTPIELCKIGDYQDYIYKNNGKWYVHKLIDKIKLAGINFQYNADNLVYYQELNTRKASTDTTQNIYCNKLSWNGNYANVAGASAMGNLEVASNNNGTSKNIFVKNTNYASAPQLNAWLAEINPDFYYVLDTPTNTEITYQPLITQLNILYNAQSMNNITYITVDGDLPIQLKVKALKK